MASVGKGGPSEPWRTRALLAPVERLVSGHLGRPWTVREVRDLEDLACHPCAVLSDGSWSAFAKLSEEANGAEQFEVELAGLKILAERAGVRTPVPLGIVTVASGSMLVLEALEVVDRGPQEWREIGRALARIHRIEGDGFGLESDGWFGPLPQDNRPTTDWPTFYAERRLRPGMIRAFDSGHLTRSVLRQVERLIVRLPELCGPEIAPALVHGDAQANNFVTTRTGAVVIDPAVHYGHPEVDLASLGCWRSVIEGSARVPIILRYAQTDGDPLEKFASELMNLPGGGHVSLSTLVEAERVEGPVSVKREQGRRFVVVMSNVKDRDLVSFVEEAQLKIGEAISLPTGYHMEWGGEFENQQRAARRLMLVVPVAVVLIFLLLFSTFRSIVQAGLVLANVPLALIGGVLALAVSGEYLSVPASVGFIALMGIAVLNGVVMVSYFNQLRNRGLAIDEVVRLGSERRLRPVLMTASIAALGLMPLLFMTGPGSEIQRPLAIVVIGGLITSTALTLFILPVLYRRFSRSDLK